MYQQFLSREGAINQGKIEVAEARLKGTVGEKMRDGEMRRQVSAIESETITYENQKKVEVQKSEAELDTSKANYSKVVRVAQIEANKAVDIRESEMQQLVEQKRLDQETERLRALELSKARVKAESEIKLAEGRAKAKELDANAELYSQQRLADAKIYSSLKDADATLAQLQCSSRRYQKLDFSMQW
jgi:flotillin